MRDASQQSGGLAGLGASVAFGQAIANTVDATQPTQNGNPIEKIREYKTLLDEGIISQEEFDNLKLEYHSPIGKKVKPNANM